MRMDVAAHDRLDADRRREVAQACVPRRVAALERPLQLDEEALAPERLREPSRRVRVPDGHGASSSRSLPGRRVLACAAVSSRQRFAYPAADSTSNVMCDPSASVTSAPVIGRTPNAFAACANSSEP